MSFAYTLLRGRIQLGENASLTMTLRRIFALSPYRSFQ